VRGVGQVERKLGIAELVQLLDHQCSKNLLRRHPTTTALTATISHQILLDPIENVRHLIQDCAYVFEFARVLVFNKSLRQSQLFVESLAHRSR
jgi:hypothetical protein